MDRKNLFDKINELESRRQRTLFELKRTADYKESLENYINDLECKIANLRKQVIQTAHKSIKN